MRRTLPLMMLALALEGTAAHGQGLIDQQTTCNDGGSAQIQFYEPIAQRFAPRGPNLVAVELLLGRFNPPYADTLTLSILEGSLGGAFVAGVTELVSAGPSYAWYRFDFPAPVVVAPGVPYVIQLDATNPSLGWAHQYELPPRCSYPDGEEIVSGVPVTGLDASFRTYTLCGNGVRDPGEQCDDGNRDDGDGCTNACAICGDGVLGAGEECDDGNHLSGDGCDANCTITGCGNGIVTTGETCDDGNTAAGDCCSPVCQLDADGAACADDANQCTSDVCDGRGVCTHPNNAAPCSDGNLCNGADTCGGGSCSVHEGNPCGSEPVCQRACAQTGPLQYTCGIDAPGVACPSDGQPCTADICNGLGLCTHPALANGTHCNDGDLCTTGDLCQSGSCQAGQPIACDPCLVCDGGSGSCVPPTGSVCSPAVPGRSSIVLRNSSDPLGDKVVWKWRGLAGLDKSELGAPQSSTGFTLCVFDPAGLRLSATATAGGLCAGRACWRDLPAGFRYTNPAASPGGVQKLQAHAGGSGQGRFAVRGRGGALQLTSLGLVPKVTVRLRRSDGGGCWEAVYSTSVASDALQFRARSD